jgi:hypothetical protein
VNKIVYINYFFIIGHTSFSNKTDAALVAKDTIKTNDIDPLTLQKRLLPAVLPGLDTAYNKRYGKYLLFTAPLALVFIST